MSSNLRIIRFLNKWINVCIKSLLTDYSNNAHLQKDYAHKMGRLSRTANPILKYNI